MKSPFDTFNILLYVVVIWLKPNILTARMEDPEVYAIFCDTYFKCQTCVYNRNMFLVIDELSKFMLRNTNILIT